MIFRDKELLFAFINYLFFPENTFSCVEVKHSVKVNNSGEKEKWIWGKFSGYEWRAYCFSCYFKNIGWEVLISPFKKCDRRTHDWDRYVVVKIMRVLNFFYLLN